MLTVTVKETQNPSEISMFPCTHVSVIFICTLTSSDGVAYGSSGSFVTIPQ